MEDDSDSNIRVKKEAKTPPYYFITKGKTNIEHTLFAIFIFIVANIVAFGYISHQNYCKNFRLDIERQLNAIADLKSDEITYFLNERLGDGGMLFKRKTFYDAVRRFLEYPEDAKNTNYLRDWLGRYATNYQYVGASIMDTKGTLRMSVPDTEDKSFCSITLKRLPEILRANRVQLGDFCRSEHDNRIYLSVLVPILDEDKGSIPLGLLILRIDPEIYLYPLINKWPIRSKTAETMLVRRYGSDVLFLNELKFRKNTALNLRFSIKTNKYLPVVKAVLGQTGIVTGRGYRGVPVVAYVRAVADSPWFLVASIDMSEAYAPMHQQLWYVALLVIASIIAIGAVIWLVWWQQRVVFYRAQYLATQTLKASEERYRRLFETTKDGMLLIDFDTGSILDVNPFLIKLLGYSRAEFLKKYFWDIGAFKNVITSKDSFLDLRSKEYVRYEDQFLETKNGKIVAVEFVSNVYLVENRKVIQCNIRDISEHKRLERELAQAKEIQYKALIENLPQSVFLKDRNSVYISCNENYAKALAMKPEEIVGKTDYDLFPTYLAEKYREDDKRIMDSGQTENIEEEYVAMKDFLRGGQNTIVNTIKVPIHDKSDNVIGLIGLLWDITEQKRVKWELAESETKFKAIFENAGDGILLADPKSKKFYMGNNAICNMLGYDPDEISKLSVMDIHLEKDLPYVMNEFERQAKGEVALTVNLPMKRKNGSVFYADVNSKIVEIGDKTYLAGFFRDSTYRMKLDAERAIILKWQRDVALLQQSLLAPSTLKYKLKAIADGIIRIFDADFCRIWLIQPGDLCEKGCIYAEVKEGPHVYRYRDKCLHLIVSSGRYTHTDGRGHSRVPFGCYRVGLVASSDDHKFLTNDVINDPHVHNHEWVRELGLVSFAGYQIKIPDGEKIGVLALFAKHPILSAEDALLDSISATIAFVIRQDIVVNELRRTDALRASTEIKSKFTSMVSHELRSPMAVIKESINLVLEGLVGSVTPEQKDVLDTAKNNIDRLGRLINNVLDFQKIESGKMEFDIKYNNLNEVVLAESKEINILAEEKGLGFTVNIDDSIPSISFDKDKIVQVLINLLSNAIKFTEKGSISISTERENNTAHVIIEDTGTGIQADDIPKLFHTFEQLGGGLGKKRGGTGLGLAISKEIIQAHNGKIWAESRFGKGSKFHFTLPIKERRG